jgi:hypothetical protein
MLSGSRSRQALPHLVRIAEWAIAEASNCRSRRGREHTRFRLRRQWISAFFYSWHDIVDWVFAAQRGVRQNIIPLVPCGKRRRRPGRRTGAYLVVRCTCRCGLGAERAARETRHCCKASDKRNMPNGALRKQAITSAQRLRKLTDHQRQVAPSGPGSSAPCDVLIEGLTACDFRPCTNPSSRSTPLSCVAHATSRANLTDSFNISSHYRNLAVLENTLILCVEYAVVSGRMSAHPWALL